MGYIARGVSAIASKTGSFIATGFYQKRSKNVVGTSPLEVVAITLDFTNITSIYYHMHIMELANSTDMEIKIGGTSKVDDDANPNDTEAHGAIDCSAISGEQQLTIEINNTAVAQTSYLNDIYLTARET